jgi:leishmanolysin-like peptidase
MTGTHTQNPIYSRITMALMEDTGWYLPNYELADELKWGSQLGEKRAQILGPEGSFLNEG